MKTFGNFVVKQLKKLNNFFTLYEKIWLSIFITIGIATTIYLQESVLYLIALIAGLIMEITLAKRSRWSFIFVLINSAALIVIASINLLYSEIIINAAYWVPFAITAFIIWSKNTQPQRKNSKKPKLTKIKEISALQTIIIFVVVVAVAYVWSLFIGGFGGNYPLLDSLSTWFQLATGILILLRLKQQWYFWMAYIFVSATIWILLQQWVMLLISLGYLTNSIYGLINWSLYIRKTRKKAKTEPQETLENKAVN